jgi:acetoin utilization deacetylase AcuC-like enzyme
MILVSAGFDAHFRDPLGGMKVTAAGFAHLARQTRQWAAELCTGRLVCILEGGYDLEGLAESACAVIEVLQGG